MHCVDIQKCSTVGYRHIQQVVYIVYMLVVKRYITIYQAKHAAKTASHGETEPVILAVSSSWLSQSRLS
jgi:hypothetical protein